MFVTNDISDLLFVLGNLPDAVHADDRVQRVVRATWKAAPDYVRGVIEGRAAPTWTN